MNHTPIIYLSWILKSMSAVTTTASANAALKKDVVAELRRPTNSVPENTDLKKIHT